MKIRSWQFQRMFKASMSETQNRFQSTVTIPAHKICKLMVDTLGCLYGIKQMKYSTIELRYILLTAHSFTSQTQHNTIKHTFDRFINIEYISNGNSKVQL